MGIGKPPANEVDRAVAGMARAMGRLIDLLKSPDESSRAGADAALRAIDPPPIWPLVEAALGSGDPAFQVRVISILEARAPTAWFQVMVALTEVLRGRTSAQVKETAVNAMMGMARPTTSGPDAARFDPRA